MPSLRTTHCGALSGNTSPHAARCWITGAGWHTLRTIVYGVSSAVCGNTTRVLEYGHKRGHTTRFPNLGPVRMSKAVPTRQDMSDRLLIRTLIAQGSVVL